MRIRYVGRDRFMRGVTGVANVNDLAAFVAAKFKARYRELRVTSGDVLVGEILPDYDNPTKRTWWSE